MVGRWSMIGHFYLKTARAVPHRHSQETEIKVRLNAFVVVSPRFEKKASAQILPVVQKYKCKKSLGKVRQKIQEYRSELKDRCFVVLIKLGRKLFITQPRIKLNGESSSYHFSKL